MITTTRDIRNYIYVLSTTDEYEHIIHVADTMQDMANLLGVDLSTISHLFNRHDKNENIIFTKNRKLERVKIYDYVYIIFKDSIYYPLFVSRDINKLSKISSYSTNTISASLYNQKSGYKPRKKINKQPAHRKIQGKYLVKRVDLLDLDLSLSSFLESCIDKGKITQTFEEFLEI